VVGLATTLARERIVAMLTLLLSLLAKSLASNVRHVGDGWLVGWVVGKLCVVVE
jgi:hypothetical protein